MQAWNTCMHTSIQASSKHASMHPCMHVCSGRQHVPSFGAKTANTDSLLRCRSRCRLGSRRTHHASLEQGLFCRPGSCRWRRMATQQPGRSGWAGPAVQAEWVAWAQWSAWDLYNAILRHTSGRLLVVQQFDWCSVADHALNAPHLGGCCLGRGEEQGCEEQPCCN